MPRPPARDSIRRVPDRVLRRDPCRQGLRLRDLRLMPSRMPEEVRRPPRILRRQVRPRVRISGRRPATHRRTYESAGARDLERVLKPAAPVTLTRSHGHPPEYPACTWNPAWMLSKTAGFVRFSHALWPMPRTDCERWSDPGGLLFETPIVVVLHGYSQRQGPVGIVLGGAPGGVVCGHREHARSRGGCASRSAPRGEIGFRGTSVERTGPPDRSRGIPGCEPAARSEEFGCRAARCRW